MSSVIGFFIILLNLTVQLKCVQSEQGVNETNRIDYRLPRSVVPSHYQIKITPYLDIQGDKEFTFTGEILIFLNVLEEVNNITLHSNGLKINKNINILELGEEPLAASYDEVRHFMILKRFNENNFPVNNYTLRIKYTGELSDKLEGFYRSSYENEKGEKVWLATTQFQPVGARRAFPCFDEPHLKATFTIIVVHDKRYHAISNMPISEKFEIDSSLTESIFKTTPRMSTYLVAFIVSDFENSSNIENNFSIYARPNVIEDTKIALDIGEKLLEKLNEFTALDLKSRIPRMYQVAIPDFAAGAMENWGLVTYSEHSILINNETYSEEEQNVIETIAHEFAHQWFGNLVSPKWWKYLWLSEGFATFFESYISQKVKPEYRSSELMVVESIQTIAFEFDSGRNTHALNVDVASPGEINNIFNFISYQKGGSIVRMMQHFLTEPVFQTGIQNYLKEKSERSADSDDLFRLMQKTIDTNYNQRINLTRIMDPWVNQKGYPLVTVYRFEDGKTIGLHQERFISFDAKIEDKVDYLWHIPINYALENTSNFEDTTAKYWMSSKSMNLSVPVELNQWVIFNKQQTGFYRVNYDEHGWQLIINALNTAEREKIHLLNRAQLINDALAFVKIDKLKFKILMGLMNYLRKETNYIAWYPGFKTIRWLYAKLKSTKYYPALQKFVTRTMKSLADSVGLEEHKSDKHIKKISRPTIASLACAFGDSNYLKVTHKKLKNWLTDSNHYRIPPNLKYVTLCCGMQKATIGEWWRAFYKSKSIVDAFEKSIVLKVLSCSANEQILETYFNLFLDSGINDKWSVMEDILENSVIGVETSLKLLSNRFNGLISNRLKLKEFVEKLGKMITTSKHLEKLKTLRNITYISSDTFEDGIKFAQINLNWIADHTKDLNEWVYAVESNLIRTST